MECHKGCEPCSNIYIPEIERLPQMTPFGEAGDIYISKPSILVSILNFQGINLGSHDH